MSPEKQLEIILSGRVTQAVNEYLAGDWSDLPKLFTLPRSMFDAWADRVELPCGRVSNKPSGCDGIYVLPADEGWLVFEQERGIHLDGERMYANYRQAKRAALSLAYLRALRGALRPT